MFKDLKDKIYEVFRPNKARRRAEERAARDAKAQRTVFEQEISRRVSELMSDTRLPENTLIIFDWDNTLFPTYEFGIQGRNFWEPELISIFAQVERAGINLLNLANTLGVLKIVTQANTCWVRNTGRNYMPELYQIISDLNIEVISARENHQATPNLDFDNYKTVEFRNLVHAMVWNAGRDPRNNGPLPVSVLSIGDGMHEYFGAQRLTELLPAERIKIIKMEEEPTAENLALELIGIHSALEEVVDSREHMCVDFGELIRS